MYTVWKGEVLMLCYHSIELNEILHDMCKDIYCQLQNMVTELLDCK